MMLKPTLLQEYPELCKELHADNTTDPVTVSPGSISSKLLWQCQKEPSHSFWQSAYGRTSRNEGCPYCSGTRVHATTNSFAARYPELLPLWHPQNEIKPTQLTSGANTKVRWWCPVCHVEQYLKSPKEKRRSGPFYRCRNPKCEKSIFDDSDDSDGSDGSVPSSPLPNMQQSAPDEIQPLLDGHWRMSEQQWKMINQLTNRGGGLREVTLKKNVGGNAKFNQELNDLIKKGIVHRSEKADVALYLMVVPESEYALKKISQARAYFGE